ncbi:MAG: hypothetical protein KDB03_15890 [Planctomycetales bacterium]|nr:hypothetical protein [Planctomycetales bacterium]
MSEVHLTPPGVQATAFQHRLCENPAKGWEKWWVAVGDRINPIVIKEVRQSLKSKQFTVSFGATLIVAIGWTLLAIVMMVPQIYYVPGGSRLFIGFSCILSFPLMIVIPFSAFRSLTSETDDSTFELLSISALSARQIIGGKMLSAMLQMLLYLSALAPCMVLTYLLRGLSLSQMFSVIGLTILYSMSLTAASLMLAAIARSKLLQGGASIALLAGVLILFFSWVGNLFAVTGLSLPFTPAVGAVVVIAVLSLILTMIALVLRAASAAIDFPAENHSTAIRTRILMLATIYLFWMLYLISLAQESMVAIVVLISIFIFSLVLGALIAGERGIISPRAQRTLPSTFLSRAALTWFYPGAGLGYIFLVCLFGAVVLTLAGLEYYYAASGNNLRGSEPISLVGYYLLCYLIIYSGIARLLMLLVPRGIAGRQVISFMIQFIFMGLCHLIPAVILLYLNNYREFDYDWHQAFNIIWTLNILFSSVTSQTSASFYIVGLCALGVFGFNLILATRDVMLVRSQQPPRIREEEAASEVVVPVDPFAE